MSKADEVRKAMVAAMKAKDKERKDSLSMLLSALKNKAIDKREDLTEAEENEVVLKEIKQTKETLEMTPADRTDIIEECSKRIAVYEEFAPKMLNEDEIKAVIDGVLKELEIETPTGKDKGRIMKVLMPKVKGIADDMLTTTVMACKCKKNISPAMNTKMFENPIVQDNLKILEHYGYEVIQPASGYLACGDTGAGKMPEPQTLLAYIEKEIACEKDLKGKKILVTAGPTQEAIDPVRYITNHSSGKMGYSIAKAAMLRGADVTLVSGRTAIEPPMFVEVVPIVTAKEMFDAVTSVSDEQDIIIKAAAVADYRPAVVSSEKVKKKDGEMSIALERTDDILKYLGEHKKENQFLCGFSMETQNMVSNSRAKLEKKNLDMIAANNVKEKGAGFQGDTNVLTLITQEEETSLPLMSKEDAANQLLNKILMLTSNQN